MASQVVPAAKRYRISLLMDTYGDLLTEKQRTFLHHYYEEDLSYGEIARQYNVSRQAIFDSVKHGEETLERFETVLRLVELDWLRLAENGLTPARLAERLTDLRNTLAGPGAIARKLAAIDGELGRLIQDLAGDDADAALDSQTDKLAK